MHACTHAPHPPACLAPARSPNKAAATERAAVGAYLNLTASQAAAALPAAKAQVGAAGGPGRGWGMRVGAPLAT